MGVPLRVGLVGTGVISRQYLDQLPALPNLVLAAVPDLDHARAAAVAAEHGVPAMGVEDLLSHPGVDVVLNLTVPSAHVEVGTRALAAGKHLYAEKPLALSPGEATGMLELARSNGLRVGSAPDTVLGTGVQTARHLLDQGRIGEPVAAAAHWSSPGHEAWHPAPEFYYRPGGGPLFDMGPYYLSALVSLLGPAARVVGHASRSSRASTVAQGPAAGRSVQVDVDTHVSATLEHASGLTSTITTSFEVWATRAPLLELHGTRGTISVADPNYFSEPTEVWTVDEPGWREAPPEGGYAGAGRGVGLADMARAIQTDRPHRASGDLAFHVLEIMDAALVSSRERRAVDLRSTVPRPDAVAPGARPDSW